MSIVFFDLETAGVLPEHANIQLAAVAVDGEFQEIDTFERKIQFAEAKADPEALKINHYDRAVWEKEARPADEVAAAFARFLDRFKGVEMVSQRTGKPYSVARLAGHNAATFDGPRLRAMFGSHFLPAHPMILDTCQRALWYAVETGEHFDSLRLPALCAHWGIEFPDAHDALADCRASIGIARHMIKDLEATVPEPVAAVNPAPRRAPQPTVIIEHYRDSGGGYGSQF